MVDLFSEFTMCFWICDNRKYLTLNELGLNEELRKDRKK